MMLFYHFLFQPGNIPQGLVDGLALSLVPVLPDDLDLLLIKFDRLFVLPLNFIQLGDGVDRVGEAGPGRKRQRLFIQGDGLGIGAAMSRSSSQKYALRWEG